MDRQTLAAEFRALSGLSIERRTRDRRVTLCHAEGRDDSARTSGWLAARALQALGLDGNGDPVTAWADYLLAAMPDLVTRQPEHELASAGRDEDGAPRHRLVVVGELERLDDFGHASALALTLEPPAGDAKPAPSAGRRPVRWFTKHTRDMVTADMLDNARRDGRIQGEQRGVRWHFTPADVAALCEAARPAIEAQLAAESNAAPKAAQSRGKPRKAAI